MQEVFLNANNINLFLMILLLPSLHSKLVPFQYQDYAYGLLSANDDDLCFEKKTENILKHLIPDNTCTCTTENQITGHLFNCFVMILNSEQLKGLDAGHHNKFPS